MTENEEARELDFHEASYLTRLQDGYARCALWASTDDDGEPLDRSHDVEDIDAEALESMRTDCEDFYRANMADLAKLEAPQAGHDFWLTRNHHGAGFWDRGLGERGDRLTTAAHAYGSSDLYVGDDGHLYVS